MMKYLQTIILVLITSFLFAQKGTNLQEYRYLTKGFPSQVEMGLDVQKKGYKMVTLFVSKNDLKFWGLYKNDTGELRAISVILKLNRRRTIAICLPNPNTEGNVWEQYYKSRNSLAEKLDIELDQALREWQFQQVGSISVNNTPPTNDLPIEIEIPNVIEEDVRGNKLTPKGGPAIPKYYQQPVARISAEPATEQNIMVDALVQLDGISDRSFIQAPVIPKGIHRADKIAVKICVDAAGLVSSAKYTMKGSTSMDASLKAIAVRSAKASRFSATTNNKESCGIMIFSFGK